MLVLFNFSCACVRTQCAVEYRGVLGDYILYCLLYTHTHTHSLDTSQIWRHSLLNTSQQSELLTYSIATLMKCVCCVCVHALDCAIIIIIYVWSTMTTVQYSLTDVDRVVHVLVTLETISHRDDSSYSIPMAMYLNCLYSSTPLCPGWAG